MGEYVPRRAGPGCEGGSEKQEHLQDGGGGTEAWDLSGTFRRRLKSKWLQVQILPDGPNSQRSSFPQDVQGLERPH